MAEETIKERAKGPRRGDYDSFEQFVDALFSSKFSSVSPEDFATFDEYIVFVETYGKPEWREGDEEAWEAHDESVAETIREADARERNRMWIGKFWDWLCFLFRSLSWWLQDVTNSSRS